MFVNALRSVGEAIDALASIPEPERTEKFRCMMDNLQEVHVELSAHLSRGIQGEIFPNDQLHLQEELPGLEHVNYQLA